MTFQISFIRQSYRNFFNLPTKSKVFHLILHFKWYKNQKNSNFMHKHTLIVQREVSFS